jgi:hypothetical protein
MIETQIIAVFVGTALGVAMLYVGVQYVFNTEIFLQKMIAFLSINENSKQYKFMKNKSNLIYHRMNGIGLIICGIASIAIPILNLLKH